ncbi:MAG: hypothetical protein D3903_21135 [Candidatus Electrothrix sp. GM3_4]|nr:hypothetical protein [Candidatus Electrothrix sp. GM3_4]
MRKSVNTTLFLTDAQARITRIDVQSIQPGAPGFEIINGIAYGEVDPSNKRNSLITDIEFALKNDDGQVEYLTLSGCSFMKFDIY